MSWRILFEGFSCGEKRKADGKSKKDPVLKEPAENNRALPAEQPLSISLPLNVECAFSKHPEKVDKVES